MKYEILEESGNLKIELTGMPLDVYTLGVLQVNLQDIVDKVAFWLLSQEGKIEPTWRRPKYLPVRQYPSHKRLIICRIDSISTGSLLEEIGFWIAAVIAQPDIRAVMQNLAATIVWAISASGIKWIKPKQEKPPLNVDKIPPLRRPDPFDVGANIRDILVTLAENRCDEKVVLKIRSKANGREDEVVLRIENE